MDIERMFMSCYKIQEKPDDIFSLIQGALSVAAYKYPAQFEKRKARIIKFLMDPSITADHLMLSDDEEDDGVVDDDEEVIKKEDEPEEEKQITSSPTNQKSSRKIKLRIQKKTTESVTELKKTSESVLVQQLDVADKQGTTQPHNTTTAESRKRMSMNMSTKRVQLAPRVKLLPDFSFEMQLDGDKQLQKQSHKGFKKMETDTEITRPMQKTTQSSAVATQKETESISYMKKFESSKRKYEERLVEQSEAKRRIIMVDFHRMPKPANGRHTPRRRWWERNRS